MPIIEIPNKICSHCNGTKWYTRTTKDGVLIQVCSVRKDEYNKKWRVKAPETYKSICIRSKNKVKHTEEYKAKNLKRVKNYCKENREKVRLQGANTYSKHKQKYKEKYAERVKERTKFNVETLSKNYVIALIRGQTRGLYSFEIPQELIDLKHKQLLLIRQIKQL